MSYEHIEGEKVPIKAWIKGVELEQEAKQQLVNLSALPFIYKHVAAMPDVHVGIGSTIGTVIATERVILPACVGVDLGCGMNAIPLGIDANKLPDNLSSLRSKIEAQIPHGRTNHGQAGDKGAWNGRDDRFGARIARDLWKSAFKEKFDSILEKHPKIGAQVNHVNHLGSLGTGNHFIELCTDQDDQAWLMLHSGSRGVGNKIGSYFIEKAKEDMKNYFVNLPDENLAYLPEGSAHFDDYVEAVSWAQDFAKANRKIMTEIILKVLEDELKIPLNVLDALISCHHNYVAKENHFGKNVWITRKGAVRAREGDIAIIPGSMGVGSYIVKGKGNPESFHSCSHGAGRKMSRGKARKDISLEQHLEDTKGIECRKDIDVLDESPAAYKSLDAVMKAQEDLVEIQHKLSPLLCIKG